MTLELTPTEAIVVLRSLALYQRAHHGMLSCTASLVADRLRAQVSAVSYPVVWRRPMTLELTPVEAVVVLRSLALWQRAQHGALACTASRVADRLRAQAPESKPVVPLEEVAGTVTIGSGV